uniref:Transmembrane protein n=1 Tax=Heterorhabditis bacteriophora TaxID=37862 RepID=A0A1I7WAD7_HETBA
MGSQHKKTNTPINRHEEYNIIYLQCPINMDYLKLATIMHLHGNFFLQLELKTSCSTKIYIDGRNLKLTIRRTNSCNEILISISWFPLAMVSFVKFLFGYGYLWSRRGRRPFGHFNFAHLTSSHNLFINKLMLCIACLDWITVLIEVNWANTVLAYFDYFELSENNSFQKTNWTVGFPISNAINQLKNGKWCGRNTSCLSLNFHEIIKKWLSEIKYSSSNTPVNTNARHADKLQYHHLIQREKIYPLVKVVFHQVDFYIIQF